MTCELNIEYNLCNWPIGAMHQPLCSTHVCDYSICWSLHFAVCCRNWWWVQRSIRTEIVHIGRKNLKIVNFTVTCGL